MILELYKTFIKENWKYYILYLLTLISLPLQNVAMPHYYGEVINSLKDKNIDKSKYLFAVLLGIWILIQALSIGISFVDNYIWPKFHSYIRQFFFNLIVDKYNQNYQELQIGSILTKLIKLPWILDDISNQFQRFLLSNTILIISNFIYLYRHHYSLGFMYIGCVGVVFIMSRIYFNTCNHNIKKIEVLYDNCHEEIEDTLQNLLSIYTSKKIPDEKARIDGINKNTQTEQYNGGICNRKFRIYFSIVNIFLFLGLNYVAFLLYNKGKIQVTSLVSIFILNYTILGSLMGLFNDAKDFMNVKSHIEIIEKFINELPKVDDSKQTKKISNPENLDIRFQNVDYTHDGSPSKMYDKFNLRLYPKQKIAVMGAIGSGKSTFAKLLSRLQTYQGGQIFINDTPLDQIDINDLRDKIVYIPQHPKLFNRTLWENISYGLPTEGPNAITREKIYSFMLEHGFKELEKEFREKMDKNVGKQGSNLSGGQRQMVWLIRAVLKPTSMVILDEPTASLDPQSKEHVKSMINILGQNRSVILITHDEDLTENMDRLIYFQKGKVLYDKNLKKGK